MMQCIELENDDMRVAVRADLGGGLAALEVNFDGQWIPVLRGNRNATWFNDLACYVLAPWSNRIRDAEFSWEGNDVALRSDWKDGTAIHGDVKEARFEILDRSPQSVRMRVIRDGSKEQNWPWKYECTVRYQLDEMTLSLNVEVKNCDTRAMPSGIGLHPFFVTRLNNAAAAVSVPVAMRYTCEGMMPVGETLDDELCQSLREGWKVKGGLDDVFSLHDSEFEASIAWPSVLRLKLTSRGGCGHAVMYSGESGVEPAFFCLEPVTHVNDGMNLAVQGWKNTGVRVLRPGESVRLETSFEFAKP